MDKLSKRQARERGQAKPSAIADYAATIAATFPAGVPQNVIGKMLAEATCAVENYIALMPTGTPRRREHRATVEQTHPSNAHRPTDVQRLELISDLYDAYMTARGPDADPDRVRGFKKTADAVLKAARLAPVSEHEQTHIRELIKQFANLANDDPSK